MKPLRIISNAMRLIWHDVSMSVRYALNVPYRLHAELIQSPSRPRRTYVFIHGIGNTLRAWDEVVAYLPADSRVISVDLLGFGDSPKPYRAVYSARMQARSIARTLLSFPGVQRPILVGHSLGALVAVELGRKYPFLFKHIVMCSPPLYVPDGANTGGRLSRDRLLRALYRTVRKHPNQMERLSPFAVRVGLTNKSFTLTHETVGAYIASLESSIVNQSALSDIPKLKLPVTIMYGTLDPLVVGANIQRLARDTPSITVYKVVAGHEVVGRYARRVGEVIGAL